MPFYFCRPTKRLLYIVLGGLATVYFMGWYIRAGHQWALENPPSPDDSKHNLLQTWTWTWTQSEDENPNQNPPIIVSTPSVPDVAEPPDASKSTPISSETTKKSLQKTEDSNYCNIPNLDPGDDKILQMEQLQFQLVGTPSCVTKGIKSNLKFKMDLNSKLVILNRNDTFWKSVTCCYSNFSRIDNAREDWLTNFSKSCYPIDVTKKFTKIPPEHEFISIGCRISRTDKLVYEDYFPNLALQSKVEARAKARDDPAVPKLSIIMIGLDSCSHMNFHRWLPKSLQFLKVALNATEFFGLNTFGAGTLESIYPALSGIHFEDFRKLYPRYEGDFLDQVPFLWKALEKIGYRTSFQEESGSTAARGFRRQPVDYDLRLLSKIMLKTLQGHGISSGASHECFGARLAVDYMLQNLWRLAHTLKGRPFFQLTWTDSLTHNVNKMTSYADEHLFRFLTKMHTDGLLNNTALLLLSDHGMRYGMMRERTEQGYLEERLPFLYLTLPPWFREKYSSAISNLESNTRRLTSYLDIYKTLLDFTNLTQVQNSVIGQRARDTNLLNNSAGISLFLPIPKNRTCESARIPPFFCICMNKAALNLSDTRLPAATSVILYWMNQKMEHFSQCARLSIEEIFEAQLLTASRSMAIEYERFGMSNLNINHSAPLDYQMKIKFKTMPGGALWEATSEYQEKTGNWVMGQISRINAYGTAKKCVPLRSLREMCICEDS